MARIAGVNIPDDKRAEIALTYIYGIGRSAAGKLLVEAGVDPDIRTKDLSEEGISKIREIIEKKYRVEGERRRMVTTDIKRLGEIGSYRGLRHQKGLPVRGQRTRTNARTRKGKRKITGVQLQRTQKKPGKG